MLENNRLDSSFIFMHLLERMIAIVAHRCYLGDFISVQIFILSLSVLALHDPDRHWPTLHHPHHLQKYHFLLLMLHETVFIFILFCNIWKRAPLLWFDPLTFPLTSATILAPFTPSWKLITKLILNVSAQKQEMDSSAVLMWKWIINSVKLNTTKFKWTLIEVHYR